RAIAVDDDVGGGYQSLEVAPSLRTPEVEHGAALAEAAVDSNGRDLIEAWRLHAQHVGTVRGEEPRGDRAGDHTREVKHAHAGQRSLGRAQRNRRARRSRLDGNQRTIRYAGSVRVRAPLLARAERS